MVRRQQLIFFCLPRTVSLLRVDSMLRLPHFLELSFEKIGLFESGFIAQCSRQWFELALFTIQDWRRQFHGRVFEGYAPSNSQFVVEKYSTKNYTTKICMVFFHVRFGPPIVRLCFLRLTVCKLIRSFRELAVVLLFPIRAPPTTRPHILGSKIPLAQCGILLFPFDCSKDNDILLKSGIVVLR